MIDSRIFSLTFRHKIFFKLFNFIWCNFLHNCSYPKVVRDDIQHIDIALYVLLKDSINELYTQLLREEDNAMEDPKNLLDVINDNNLQITSGDFKDYIITKYYDEENLERTFSLYLMN